MEVLRDYLPAGQNVPDLETHQYPYAAPLKSMAGLLSPPVISGIGEGAGYDCPVISITVYIRSEMAI